MSDPQTILLEDRHYGGSKPYIDLTEARQWGRQVQKHIGSSAWDAIKKHVAERVGNTCELCSANGIVAGFMGQRAHRFNIEFRYEHNEATKVATLRRLVYTCASCSMAIHLRQTEMSSKDASLDARSPFVGALQRLSKFNDMAQVDILKQLRQQQAIGLRRLQQGYPENINVDIVEDGVNRLWKMR
jgi:hypothetical protein